MASVAFKVDCKATRPGEGVFVVGNHEALGAWKPAKALQLTTTAQQFPTWSCHPLTLSADADLEFKFLVQREDMKGPARWEEFPGNRTAKAVIGQIVETKSLWGDAKSSVTSKAAPASGSQPAEQSPSKGGWLSGLFGGASEPSKEQVEEEQRVKDRQEQDDVLLKMAEIHVKEAQAETVENNPLAVTINEREEMRRNFSQSLLALDSLSVDPTRPTYKEEPDTAVTQVRQVSLNEEGEAEEEYTEPTSEDTPARGVGLQHIMSFSALTSMMPVEEKQEARTGKAKAQSHYEPFNTNVPVIIVSSEMAPYSKTGGLGLVAASYSYEFPRNGHRTMAISPKYKHYDGLTYAGETRVRIGNREECVKYWHKYEEVVPGTATTPARGCDYIFVEGAGIERSGGLYNGDDGREYEDNLFRFAILSFAAMEAPLILRINGSTYGDKVLFLANDWQSGLVPLLLCYKYRNNGCYTNSRCIYVVHNLGYQGQYHNVKAGELFGLEGQAAGDCTLGKAVNLTKGALICADRVLTVSPNYAQEIQTPGGGFNLQDFVRAKAQSLRLAGILNGIDDCWNPETDKDIKFNFFLDNFEEGKRLNKAELQKMLGLEVQDDVCLLGFVGRLTWQKGIDIFAQAISWMMKDEGNGVTGKVQLIMMGNGEKQHAETLRWAESNYPRRICGYVGFDPKVEHQMMAGCDLFVMPSRYEPCGLPQMYAQAYGTIPLVHACGGLVDSVKDISQGIDKATGFHIHNLGNDQMKGTLWKALELFHKDPDGFRTMQRNAMNEDYYWPQAMDEYEKNIDYTLYDPCVQR